MEQKIYIWIEQLWGLEMADRWTIWVTIAGIALAAWLSYLICIFIIIPIINYLTVKTETKWDDDLLNEKVLRAVSQLVPAIIVANLLPNTLHFKESAFIWSERLTRLYILWAAIHLVIVFLHGLQNAFDKRRLLRRHNLEIVRQTIVLFVVIIGVIVGIAILIDKSPVVILTGLGASAAVLMLVFRDTILNFVAGIQLTVNNMLGRGDWIISQKAGANGEVEEVKLTTIKIRNWDNSIITIPPYTLFTDSFQNFQAMRRSGARRVARSVLIDQTSIRNLTENEIEELRTEGLIRESKQEMHGTVNLGLLRSYMESFLETYPTVIHDNQKRPDIFLMVRMLDPTPQGVPIQLYFFTSVTAWKAFEHIQADVFDHFYTVIPKFHLSVYQAPSSTDFMRLRTQSQY